ncbi:MAG: hypothetical protein HGGPFJEG_02486 [Ignavibacteria bacterium]|nr:hypothetical protein [Ignavibacteria bacterium]
MAGYSGLNLMTKYKRGMQLKPSGNFDDKDWMAYADLQNNINRKYYKEDFEPFIHWENYKETVLNDLQLLKNDQANHFLIYKDGIAAGFYARRLMGSDVNFVFDFLVDNVTDDFIKIIFEDLHTFLLTNCKDFAYSNASDMRISASLVKSGAEEIDKMIYSRLLKSEINETELRDFVNCFSLANGLRLKFNDNVSEDIFDRYYEIYNEARIAMNEFNPHRKEVSKRTKENLRVKLKYDKGDEDKMYMYILFDGDEIAAFSSLYVRKENPKMIDHGGGLTAVSPKYRGNKYAKFLKSKLYLRIIEDYDDFDFIRTDTYPWNKYMFNINQEMGFKPYKEYSEFRISKINILENLKLL